MGDRIITNKKGGRQSYIGVAYDCLDPVAMEKLAEVLYQGFIKYGADNWRLIPCVSHLNHALAHIMKFLMGDKSEDHLEHAFCRLMMAVAMKHRPRYRGRLSK